MISALLLVLSLAAAPEYPSGAVVGVMTFDMVYNGLRVGAFSEDPFYKGFFKGAVLGFCQFGTKLLMAKQATTHFYTPIKTAFNVCNSMADNLQFRRGLFDQINIPFGVGTYVYVRGKNDYVTLNPAGVGQLIYTAVKRPKMDVVSSLLTLQPIFWTNREEDLCPDSSAGCIASGIIYRQQVINSKYKQKILNHELNHSVVYESFYHVDGMLDKYLLTWEPFKYIDLSREIMTLPLGALPYEQRLHEIEAYTLSETP